MIDLTNLIEFTAPGSIVSVARAPGGGPADPWPDIATWTDADYQAALDTLVTWADGATIPPGAAVRANVAAWQASIPTLHPRPGRSCWRRPKRSMPLVRTSRGLA